MTKSLRVASYVALGTLSLTGALRVLAAPPSTTYNPGDTLTPNCLPNSTNCRVDFSFAAKGSNSDITSLSGLTMPLSPAQGGTGINLYAVGDVIYASGTSTLSALHIGSDGQVLAISAGMPMWIDAAAVATSTGSTTQTYSAGTGLTLVGSVFSVNQSQLDLSLMGGVVPVTKGGTGQTSFTANTLLYASGATAISSFANGSDGQVLKMAGGVPTWTATSSLGISSGGGTTYSAGAGLNLMSTTFSVDESSLNLGNMTGIVGVAHGGTGLSSAGSNGQVLSIVGGAPAWVATSSLGFTSGGGGGGGIGSVSGIVKGDGAGNASAAVAGTDYESPLTFSAPLSRTGDTISIAAGRTIPFTASTTEWNLFYQTPSSRITAGTHLSWSGNTLNADLTGITTDDITEGAKKYYSDTQVADYVNGSSTMAHPAGGTSGNIISWNGSRWVSVATTTLGFPLAGIDYESPLSFATPLSRSGNTISVVAGRTIPLTASTTEWNAFYQAPSSRIAAGTHLSWAGNTLNADFTGITTDDVVQGTNKYYSDTQVAAYINGSSTIAHPAGGAVNNILSWNGSRWVSVATSTLFNSSIAWSVITGTPTSLSGYGVTNGAALDSLGAVGSNGILVRTGSGTYTSRTIQGTTNRVTLTNGDGVSGNPTVDISASYAGQASITTLGTVSSGTWNGTALDPAYGGTGQTSYSPGDILYATGATTLAKLPAASNGNVLSLASGAPAWVATSTLGFAPAGAVGPGTTGQMPYYASSGSSLTATSTLTVSSASKVGIGSTTPNDLLSVGGTASFIHIKGQGGTPSASAGGALTLGSGGTVVVRGTDTAGEVTFTLGSGGILGLGTLVNVTFASAYGTAPYVVLTPSGSAAASLPIGLTSLNVYVTTTTSGFTVTGVGVAISGVATYKWNYIVIQ